MGAATETYAYVSTTEQAYEINPGTATDSLVGPDGARIATKTGSVVGWTLGDLHGNFIGDQDGSRATQDLIRFDPYGETVCTFAGSAPLNSRWRYQGRLDVSPNSDPLYDGGARFYAPSAGVFTSLDSVMGSAQNPRSMNRFLYAEANPTTLVDPTGHAVRDGGRDVPVFENPGLQAARAACSNGWIKDVAYCERVMLGLPPSVASTSGDGSGSGGGAGPTTPAGPLLAPDSDLCSRQFDNLYPGCAPGNSYACDDGWLSKDQCDQKTKEWRTVVTLDEAKALFAAQLEVGAGSVEGSSVTWYGPYCWSRAHLMSLELLNRGVIPTKVWSFAPVLGTGTGGISTSYANGAPAEFDYHVAPAVDVMDPSTGQIRSMVIDPSLFDGPVSLTEWYGKQKGWVEASQTNLGEAPTLKDRRLSSLPLSGIWPASDPTKAQLQGFYDGCRDWGSAGGSGDPANLTEFSIRRQVCF